MNGPYLVRESNFRNYDIRGEFPTEIDATTAYAVGRAFVEFTGCRRVAVGMDMRTHSPVLQAAMIEALRDSGVEVHDIGLTSTDGLYFATWHYKLDGGIMITASHLEQQFNGFKFLNREYQPIGRGSGMEELYRLANKPAFPISAKRGNVVPIDIWGDFTAYVHGFVDTKSLRPFHVVADPGNGMGWYVGQHVYKGLAPKWTVINDQPDGSFPNHVPNPILPENRTQIIEKIKSMGADLGVAWDADCDRVYFFDEHGSYIDGDFSTALMAKSLLRTHPGAGIVYDIRASRAVPDHVREAGGSSYAERVGHSFIKARMKKENALFGGEVSGHYYFQSNAYAENSFAAVLLMLDIMSREGKPLSQLISELGTYYISGEINSKVKDPAATIKKLAEHYHDAVAIDYRDGVTIEFSNWHCNVRPSANDPVLRLNLEADSQELMTKKRDEVLALIRS